MSDSENMQIIHFIIASSPFILIYPYIYLYHSYSQLSEIEKSESVISFEILALLLPLLAGGGFALTYEMLTPIVPRKIKNTYFRYIISGIVTSLLISLIFHYGFHIQDKWIKMSTPETSHLLVPLFYTIIFYTLGVWLRSHILYGSSPSNVIAPKMAYSMPSSPSISPKPSHIPIPISKNNTELYNQLEKLATNKN
jgi:hypothetical protein